MAAIPKPFGRVPGAALIALTNSRQASCEMVGFRYSHTFDKVSNLLICLVRAIVRDVNGGPDPNVACARGETDRLPVEHALRGEVHCWSCSFGAAGPLVRGAGTVASVALDGSDPAVPGNACPYL